MTQTSNIETNRLVLRPFSESDAPDVFESCKNPNLGNNAGWKPHETIEETIDVLNAIFIGKEGFGLSYQKRQNKSLAPLASFPIQSGRIRMPACWDIGWMRNTGDKAS